MSSAPNPLRVLAWRLVKRWVDQQFPDVPSLATDQLARWLVNEQPSPILIDVRDEAEYAVSHLPGARHLPTLEAIRQADISPTSTLVLYCSVGYRSARLADKLQAAGYPHVFNLEGSIFEWHNQGRSLVAGQQPVDQVHPYNRLWGLLLRDRGSG